MATIVVPFRGTDPKRRLDPLDARVRALLAAAMLADVVDAARARRAGARRRSEPPPLPAGCTRRPRSEARPGRCRPCRAGRSPSSAALPAPFLIVNADLPCVTARDLLALAGAVPEHGLALAAAADGTTNALALSDERAVRAGLRARAAPSGSRSSPSRARSTRRTCSDDVDTLADLARVASRVGEHTRRVLPLLHLGAAA